MTKQEEIKLIQTYWNNILEAKNWWDIDENVFAIQKIEQTTQNEDIKKFLKEHFFKYVQTINICLTTTYDKVEFVRQTISHNIDNIWVYFDWNDENDTSYVLNDNECPLKKNFLNQLSKFEKTLK